MEFVMVDLCHPEHIHASSAGPPMNRTYLIEYPLNNYSSLNETDTNEQKYHSNNNRNLLLVEPRLIPADR